MGDRSSSGEEPQGGFLCRICGQIHPELPMHYGTDAPHSWHLIDESERDRRVEINRDLCVIDDKFFFIVGNLELPVIGSDQTFSWDVWVSLSEASFVDVHKNWNRPGREASEPYFGWLNTSIPGYPETVNLKTMVQTREVGRRPRVDVEPTDHPLAVEQQRGITWNRVRDIAEQVLHGIPDSG